MTHQNGIKKTEFTVSGKNTNTDSCLLMLRLEEKTNGDIRSQLSFLTFWSQFFHDDDNTYCSASGVHPGSSVLATPPRHEK